MNIVEVNIMNFLTSVAEREMHYIKDADGLYYMLSLGDDNKIEEIGEDENVECETYAGDDFSGTAEVITDHDRVREVFDIMTDKGENWFAEYSDDIVLIIVTPS